MASFSAPLTRKLTGARTFSLIGYGDLPPINVPGAPTIGAVTGGDAQAVVNFTAPASNGGSAITGYTVTSSPGGLTATGASSPLTVTGLTNGVSYTFTVVATNAAGSGPASASSAAVVPQAVPVNTSSLMHMEGTNASTTFADAVTRTWTALGNAQISTAQFKFGAASGLFDGVGDYLTTPADATLQVGTGDVTIEMWIRPGAGAGTQNLLSARSDPNGITFRMIEPNRIQFFQGAGLNQITSPTNLAADTWHHVAFTRQGTTTRLFQNGALVASGTSSANLDTSGGIVAIGGWHNAGVPSDYYQGSIDEFRFTKGLARYTAAFTPPTSAFSVD